MRKVVIYELISLNGVAQDPEEFITEWDERMDANLGEVIESQDAVILGRHSYDEWSRFWPESEMQPFADFINGTQKYIASHRALDVDWSNTSAIEGDVVEFVRGLKSQPVRNIGTQSKGQTFN